MNIKAYAKFNLTLDVKNKRGDGYHEISSLMQEISVCDDLSILVKNASSVPIRKFRATKEIPVTKRCSRFSRISESRTDL